MDQKIAEMLKRSRVRDIQITLDGPKEIHDSRRIYRGGKGSFEQIVDNISKVIGIVHISVRINVDKSNIAQAWGAFESIRSQPWYHPEKIAFYYGWVRGYTDQVVGGGELDLDPQTYHKQHEEFGEMLQSVGARQGSYPFPSAGCVATTVHGYVIGPMGDIWKCWSNLGEPDKIIGNVREGINRQNNLYLAYMEETWETDEECRNCKVLPICMGGCGDIRIKRNDGKLEHKDCGTWRYSMENKIRKYYTQLAAKAQKQPVAEPMEV